MITSNGTPVLIGSLGLSIAAVLGIAGPASAEMKPPSEDLYELPLKGTYGNKDGCAKEGEAVGDGRLYITSTHYGGWEWSCDFVYASGKSKPNDGDGRVWDRVWTVITSCGGEGIPSESGLITVWEDPEAMKLTILDSNAPRGEEPIVLNRCN